MFYTLYSNNSNDIYDNVNCLTIFDAEIPFICLTKPCNHSHNFGKLLTLWQWATSLGHLKRLWMLVGCYWNFIVYQANLRNKHQLLTQGDKIMFSSQCNLKELSAWRHYWCRYYELSYFRKVYNAIAQDACKFPAKM